MAPMALMIAGLGMAAPLVLSIAMIWLAHIGFDRALGYGLKYSAGFGFTHLGRLLLQGMRKPGEHTIAIEVQLDRFCRGFRFRLDPIEV
jgi:hypothetical protein